MPDMPLITDLPEPTRDQALQRFALIQPFLQDGVPLATIAQQHEVSLRTLRRWVALYRRHGFVGLSRPVRTDRGSYRRVTPELQAVIEGLALRAPALSVAAIYRQIVTLTRTHGWAVPAYGTVYTIVRRLPAALTTLAHEGLSGIATSLSWSNATRQPAPMRSGKLTICRWISGFWTITSSRPGPG